MSPWISYGPTKNKKWHQTVRCSMNGCGECCFGENARATWFFSYRYRGYRHCFATIEISAPTNARMDKRNAKIIRYDKGADRRKMKLITVCNTGPVDTGNPDGQNEPNHSIIIFNTRRSYRAVFGETTEAILSLLPTGMPESTTKDYITFALQIHGVRIHSSHVTFYKWTMNVNEPSTNYLLAYAKRTSFSFFFLSKDCGFAHIPSKSMAEWTFDIHSKFDGNFK